MLRPATTHCYYCAEAADSNTRATTHSPAALMETATTPSSSSTPAAAAAAPPPPAGVLQQCLSDEAPSWSAKACREDQQTSKLSSSVRLPATTTSSSSSSKAVTAIHLLAQHQQTCCCCFKKKYFYTIVTIHLDPERRQQSSAAAGSGGVHEYRDCRTTAASLHKIMALEPDCAVKLKLKRDTKTISKTALHAKPLIQGLQSYGAALSSTSTTSTSTSLHIALDVTSCRPLAAALTISSNQTPAAPPPPAVPTERSSDDGGKDHQTLVSPHHEHKKHRKTSSLPCSQQDAIRQQSLPPCREPRPAPPRPAPPPPPHQQQQPARSQRQLCSSLKQRKQARSRAVRPALAAPPAAATSSSAAAASADSWSLLVIASFLALLCVGLAAWGATQHHAIIDQQPHFNTSEAVLQSSTNYFSLDSDSSSSSNSPELAEDELDTDAAAAAGAAVAVHEAVQERHEQNNAARFTDEEDSDGERSEQDEPDETSLEDANKGKKGTLHYADMTNIERMGLTSCRTTIKGIDYNGKADFPAQLRTARYVPCTSWDQFNIIDYLHKHSKMDKKNWRYVDPKKLRKHIQPRLNQTFTSAARSARYWCRNIGGLFDEPSCMVDEAHLRYIARSLLPTTPIVRYKSARLLPCGVPLCPAFFGPHAGKQCIIAPPGTAELRPVCLPFRDYLPPPGALHCDDTDATAGPTYTWTHPTHGYSLTIPTAAPPCRGLRRALLVKGGYRSLTWFELPALADYTKLKVSPHADERPVELIVQFRYSADRRAAGYSAALTSRHLNIIHAQQLLHLADGHVPLLTDFPSLYYIEEVQLKHVQHEAKDVLHAMNPGTVTDVTFTKRGRQAQLAFRNGNKQQQQHAAIDMSTPSETDRFPRFVRLFSDDMVDVQLDAHCPVVHVFENLDLRQEVLRYRRNTTVFEEVWADEFPSTFPFRHQEEGVYFRLQRKKRSTAFMFYHYYSAGRDRAKVFFSTFPKPRSGVTLHLKPPYHFSVETTRGNYTEWEQRETGPFDSRALDLGWHGYSVRFSKAALSLHHVSGRGKATLIYRAAFLTLQPPMLYAFFQAAGGKFTVNCQPRYGEYAKSLKGSRRARLSLTGREYFGLKTTSRSGRLCAPSQHSPQGLCRTWDSGRMLYHGPCCRVLTDKDFNTKLQELNIPAGQEAAAIKGNMSQPESPFFGFGFESCDIPHTDETDPSFHYFSVLYRARGLQSSELIDLRTVRHRKLEFGYMSAGFASHGAMSILFLDKFRQRRMQIVFPVFRKYVVMRAFHRGRETKIHFQSNPKLKLTTETNYSHCELQMSASDVFIFCWDFNAKQMQQVVSLVRYDQIFNDKRPGILQYISFGTINFSQLTASLNVLRPLKKLPALRPAVNMWRVRVSCAWFEVPASTSSHLRPLRLDQQYYLSLSQDAGNVSINFYNSAVPTKHHERPLEINFVPGQAVNVKHVSKYRKVMHQYISAPLDRSFTFSVSKLDTKLWLSVAAQLCPRELRTILKDRRAARWTNAPKGRIIFVADPRSQRVLWEEGGLVNTEEALQRLNLTLHWFPQQCGAKIPINSYVVVVRSRSGRIQYVIQADDDRGLDAATLQYFSVQAHGKPATLALSSKPCTPLTTEQLAKQRGGHFALTSRGTCSKTCDGGFRVLEYKCIRPLNGDLCDGSALGLPKQTLTDTVKLWRSCNMHACYVLTERLQDIVAENMTVALGQHVNLTCLDRDYLYHLKETLPKQAALTVHWLKDDQHYHQQTNTIAVTVLTLQDTGLFHCYLRYNHLPEEHPIKAVGLTPDKNERYGMIFDRYEFEMRADQLLATLNYQVMASWFHRARANETFRKVRSGFMGTTETLELNELQEEELGEYLGCLKPFRRGITVQALQSDYGEQAMACPVFVQLVPGHIKKRLRDKIHSLLGFNKKYFFCFYLCMLLNMIIFERLMEWLRTRRNVQKVDFDFEGDVEQIYGEKYMFSLADYRIKKKRKKSGSELFMKVQVKASRQTQRSTTKQTKSAISNAPKQNTIVQTAEKLH